MGGFVSKVPEELESAEKSSDATRERKKDLVEIKETRNAFGKVEWALLFICCVLRTVNTTIEIVSRKYWRYVTAKETLKMSKREIRDLLKSPKIDRDRKWKEELKYWKYEQESSVAFMKKHKYIGKLVEKFPPKPRPY